MTERVNHRSSRWRCILCETTFGTRANALRHLRTIHQPIVHHRCSGCGICMKTDYDLRRHKIACHPHSSRNSGVRRCNHRPSQRRYVMLPKNDVADDYLIHVRANGSIEDDDRRQESDKPSSSSCSESMNQDNIDCGPSSEFVSSNDSIRVRVARRENDSFDVCIGKGELQSHWPCPRCKLPFRTPQGLATHLRYMYEGF